MKKLFLLLLCAAFAMVGCEDVGGNGTTDMPEEPIFVTNIDGNYNVPAAGGDVEISVATNIEYTVDIPAEAKAWVTLAETRSLRQEKLLFTIAENTTAVSRTADVKLLGSDGKVLNNAIFVQAAGSGNDPNDEPNVDPSEIILSADKTSVEVGEVITFTVKEVSGKNVTATATIYDLDYNVVSNAKYKADTEGTFKFFATRNGYTSNTLIIKVGNGVDNPEQPEEGAFLHKVLLIDHTAMGCGYCPNAIDNLRKLANQTSWGPYYNEVSCHAGRLAGNDPAGSQAATMLNEFQGSNGLINGYPTIAVNLFRSAKNYTYTTIASVLSEVVKKDGADVGISLSVEKGSSKVICSAQIKAAVSNEYKVNAWLLENNIYSPDQNGATEEYHRYYNHALRATSESVSYVDFSGKSLGMIYMGETRDYNCEIPVQSSWEMNNLEVLIVVTARNGSNQWDVVNTAVCGVGQTTPFAYVQ